VKNQTKFWDNKLKSIYSLVRLYQLAAQRSTFALISGQPAWFASGAGVDVASKFWGVDFSNIWHLAVRSPYGLNTVREMRCSILHNTAVTKE